MKQLKIIMTLSLFFLILSCTKENSNTIKINLKFLELYNSNSSLSFHENNYHKLLFVAMSGDERALLPAVKTCLVYHKVDIVFTRDIENMLLAAYDLDGFEEHLMELNKDNQNILIKLLDSLAPTDWPELKQKLSSYNKLSGIINATR